MPPEMLLLAALDGLAYGSLIFLVAVGLSLIFGVLGIINVAHGSFYAIGAYVAAAGVLAIGAMGLPAWLALRGNQLLAWTVTGKLRWYAASMGIGAVLVLALLLLG